MEHSIKPDPSEKQTSWFPIHPWVLGIILGFMVIVSVNFYVIWIANEKPVQMVTERYYDKALQYNEEIAVRQRSQALAPHLTESVSTVGGTLNYRVEASPSFPESVPLHGELTLYRPSDAKQDQTVPMNRTPAGWEAQVSSLSSGPWNTTFELKNEQGVVIYKQVRPIVIVP